MSGAVLYGGPVAGPYDVYVEVETAAGRTPMSKSAWSDAMLNGRAGSFSTRAALLADTVLGYGTLAAGDVVAARDGTKFEVADSAATDQHATTGGGLKLYEAGPVFTTRDRLSAAITRGRVWNEGTILTVGAAAWSVPAGTVSSISDLVPLSPDIRLTQFGAKGDGTTDDRAALASALTATWGGPIKIDEVKTFKVPLIAGQSSTPAAGTAIFGGYQAKLSVEASGSGTVLLWGSAADMRLSDIEIAASHATNGGTVQVMYAADRLTLDGVTIDGGVVASGGSPSHVAQAIEASGNDAEDVTIWGGLFKRLSRILLRTSASTTVLKKLSTFGIHAKNMTSEEFAVNVPNGTGQMIQHFGYVSEDNIGISLGGSAHALGASNVQCFGVFGGGHIGTGDEFVHLEEGTSEFSIVGTIGAYIDAKSAFFVTDNNVGGTAKPVTRGYIVGGAHRRATRGSGNYGLDLANNGSSTAALEFGGVADIVLSGWAYGGRSDNKGVETTLLHDIIFHDNATGFLVAQPTQRIHDNLLAWNDTPLEIQKSGIVGRQHIHEAGTWDGTSRYTELATVSAGHIAGLSGWTVEYDGLTVAYNGGVNKDYLICPLGKQMSGRLRIGVFRQDTQYRIIDAEIVWDGTNLAVDYFHDVGSGITSLGIINAGPGSLAVQLNVAADITDCLFQASFDGIHLL